MKGMDYKMSYNKDSVDKYSKTYGKKENPVRDLREPTYYDYSMKEDNVMSKMQEDYSGKY